MIVLCHEAGHVRHRHSAERIAVELVRSLFWFNPFVWIAGRWLQEVHEWEADRGLCFARDEPQRQVIARAVPLKLTEPRR